MNMDTIAAIATPPGRGGVGILRLSGSLSYSIAQKISKITSIEPRKAYYQAFYADDDVIDNGILLYFKAPHSFTGEEVVEFQVHGSPFVLDRLLRTCIAFGARLARAGEFSERAFLNNKIDLIQAEAIADLIEASSDKASRMAVRSLQGDFSKTIQALNERLIQLRLYVEAAIDFPEEDIDFLNDGVVAAKLQSIDLELTHISKHAQQGALLREGMSVVIAGAPNAGKSTLINALSGREVAIVTPIAGTTRDVMREHIVLDDIPLHIIDTAGLRISDDVVEQEGIKRAWQEVHRADCVLLMMDANSKTLECTLEDEIKAQLPAHVPMIRIINKIDTLGLPAKYEENSIFLSAKTGEGIDLLTTKIKALAGIQTTEGLFLARRRHLQALDSAHALIKQGIQQLSMHRAGELLAEDLRQAHQILSEITGEFTSDDLLGEIFSSFCIGK
jgi:tRNA modification GTPase